MPSANKSLGPDLVNRPLKFCSNLLTVRHQAQDPVPSAVLFGWRCGKTCCEASGSNVTWKRQNKPGRNRNTHTHTPNKQKSRNGWAASTVKTFLFYGCCRIKYCRVWSSSSTRPVHTASQIISPVSSWNHCINMVMYSDSFRPVGGRVNVSIQSEVLSRCVLVNPLINNFWFILLWLMLNKQPKVFNIGSVAEALQGGNVLSD